MINPQNKYTTYRIWKETAELIRRIYGVTGESRVAMLHRLVKQEYERVQAQEHLRRGEDTPHDEKL